jgi:hypothetical protein
MQRHEKEAVRCSFRLLMKVTRSMAKLAQQCIVIIFQSPELTEDSIHLRKLSPVAR